MAFETTPNIEQSWQLINYPVGIPAQGILAADTWDQLDQELEVRYRAHGQIHPNRQSHGDDKEHARVEEYNSMWSQYPNFTYQTNNMGFRDNHDPMDSVDHCYYGCSMTYGEGVPLEGIWTSQLDQQLNTTSNNFGIGGTSPEECMFMFMATSRLVKMKRAVFLFPDFHRKMVCVGRERNQQDCIYWPLLGVHNWNNIPHIKQYHRNIRDTHDAHYRLSGVYMMDTFRNAVQTILYVAELKGIEVVMGTWNDCTAQMLRHMAELNPTLKIAQWCPMTDIGRDNHHPGIVTQANWAREFAKVI
jgi:hypothetical protein